jgi:predicted acylesterase/phospholipase RssA
MTHLDKEQIRKLLKVTLLFWSLTDEELEPLVEQFDPLPKLYARHGIPIIEAHPPLRLILSGTVQLGESFLAGLGPVSCGAYSITGIESVAKWAAEKTGPLHTQVLHPTSSLRVLELPYERFHSAFAPGSAALERIRQASQATQHALSYISTMLADPYLANASVSALFQLLQAATVQTTKKTESLTLQRLGQEVYVFTKGTCTLDYLAKGLYPVVIQSPRCVGVEQVVRKAVLGLEEPLLQPEATASQRSSFARIPSEAVQRLAEINSGFKLALTLNAEPPPHTSSRSGKPRTSNILLASAEGLHLPMHELSEQLTQAMARHLGDHVLLLRLHEPLEGKSPAFGGRSDACGTGGWVQLVTAAAPWGFDGLATLITEVVNHAQQETPSKHGEVDFVVVDASALTLAQQRSYGARGIQVVFLSEDPTEAIPVDYILNEAPVLITGVLSSEQPEGVGMTLRALCEGQRWSRGTMKGLFEQLFQCAKSTVVYPLSVLLLQDQDIPAWPEGAVILRLLQGPTTGADGRPLDDENAERWARAVTGRRVGVALGGGGAYGFAHVPLLRRLVEGRIVPIDMVAGTSFGSLVGAYFCGAGLEGVDALVSRAPLYFLGALFGPLSTAPLRWLVNLDVGVQPVSELETPLLPVVTNTNVGVEWSLRNVTLGLGVQASGSLAPFPPTIVNNRRYLDGGPTANVPVDVLREEGARMIIASNPIPLPTPEPEIIQVPLIGPLYQLYSPIVRLSDSVRVMQMMTRTAGLSQQSGTNVVNFNAPVTVANPLSFLEARRVIRQVEQNAEALNVAVAEAENKWFETLNHPMRVEFGDLGMEFVVKVKATLFLVNGKLPSNCEPGLGELVRFLEQRHLGHKRLVSFQISVHDSKSSSLAKAVQTFLQAHLHGLEMTTGCEPRVPPHQICLTKLGWGSS